MRSHGSPDIRPVGQLPGHSDPAQESVSGEIPLGEKLKHVIDYLPSEGVTLAQIRDNFGQEGLLFLTIFLTIPFLVPVSIPGVSTVFGAAILGIGISRSLGRNVWMPRRLECRLLPAEKLRAGLNQGLKFVHQLERLTCPYRLRHMTSYGVRGTVNNYSLILGALLLMAPFGFVPFSNTLPGLALMFLSIGLLQRDGVFIVLGHVFNLVTIAYFGLLMTGGVVVFQRLWQAIAGAVS